jgi:hypothetical protein
MPTESHTTNPSNIIDATGRFDGGVRGRARFDSDGNARFAAIPEAEFPWTMEEWAMAHGTT